MFKVAATTIKKPVPIMEIRIFFSTTTRNCIIMGIATKNMKISAVLERSLN